MKQNLTKLTASDKRTLSSIEKHLKGSPRKFVEGVKESLRKMLRAEGKVIDIPFLQCKEK